MKQWNIPNTFLRSGVMSIFTNSSGSVLLWTENMPIFDQRMLAPANSESLPLSSADNMIRYVAKYHRSLDLRILRNETEIYSTSPLYILEIILSEYISFLMMSSFPTQLTSFISTIHVQPSSDPQSNYRPLNPPLPRPNPH